MRHCRPSACASGGPALRLDDPLLFYETSSYGPTAVDAMQAIVGPRQLLYGSDRPVVEPSGLEMPGGLDWETITDSTREALGHGRADAAG